MTITVLTAVTSKDKPYLKDCLQSLESSASIAGYLLNFIIIENGTRVPFPIYLHNPAKLISVKTKIGFGESVNLAMSSVKNPWCLIVSPDVIIHKDCLKNIIPSQFDNKTAIIGPKVKLENGKLQYTILPNLSVIQIFLEQSYLYKLFPKIVKSPLSDSYLYKYVHQVDAIMAIFWMVNKDAFIRIGGFDERFRFYFEDLDLCKRLKDNNCQIIFNPDAQVTHLMHKSTGGETDGRIYKESLRKYLYKYQNPLLAKISLFIFLAGSLVRLIYWKIILLVTSQSQIKSKARYKIRYFREII